MKEDTVGVGDFTIKNWVKPIVSCSLRSTVTGLGVLGEIKPCRDITAILEMLFIFIHNMTVTTRV